MRRYNGNSGRYEYIPDQRPALDPIRNERGTVRGAPLGNEVGTGRGKSHGNEGGAGRGRMYGNEQMRQPKKQPQTVGTPRKESRQSKDLLGSLQSTLSNLFSQGFENEDLLLFAVLFLMYQETHDKELLIIMGGMFLL